MVHLLALRVKLSDNIICKEVYSHDFICVISHVVVEARLTAENGKLLHDIKELKNENEKLLSENKRLGTKSLLHLR